MVMNKKGYLRILEGVIAIIIVFSTVLLVLPKIEKNLSKAPPDIELTANTILKEAQTNDNFRNCILTTTNPQIDSTVCIKDTIENLRPSGSSWDFALKLCDSNNNPLCKYYSPLQQNINAESTFNSQGLPSSKDIFTKSVILSVVDPTSNPLPSGTTIAPNKILRIYFWFK